MILAACFTLRGRSWHTYRFTVVFVSGLKDFPSNSREFSVTSVFEV